MDGLLDPDQISLFAAMVNDEAHKERLTSLLNANLEAQKTLKAVQEARAALEQLRQQVDAKHVEARRIADAAKARSAALDEREKTLQEVNDKVLAEQAEFNRIRSETEADLKKRNDATAVDEIALREARKSVVDRENAVTARENKIKGLHESLQAKHEALRKIVNQ